MRGILHTKVTLISLLTFISSACTALPTDALQRVSAQESFDICPIKVAADQRIISDVKTWGNWQSKSPNAPYSSWKPDFTKDRIVVFSMGEKRSGGFSSAIAGTNLDRDVLTVKIEQKVPPAGSFNAAQITNPCVIGLVDARDAKSVQLVDLVTGGAL